MRNASGCPGSLNNLSGGRAISVKIGIIGAGSAVFSVSLIKDICLTPALRGSTVCFMDLDPRRLKTAFELCSRYARELGVSLKLEKTTSRRECLRGADFVINTALAREGGYSNLREGWRRARRHGYRLGGSLHVMHDEAFWVNFYQLQLMESIVKDMLLICPKAWLLLVANPVFAGTTFLKRKYPRLKMVGLCHGFSGIYWLACRLGFRDREKISFEMPGVNHFVWATSFRYRGRDAFPALERWIATKAKAFWRSSDCGYGDEAGPKKVDLYRKLGAYPIGDTASAGGGAWGFWYHSDWATERAWKEDLEDWWLGYFRHCAAQPRSLERELHDRKIKMTERYGTQKSGEVMIPLVEAMACGVRRKLVVNIPNDGDYVPGIPREVAVEVQGFCDARGIQGIKTGGLPAPVLGHVLRDYVQPVETELLAYERRDRKLLLSLIMTDPWTGSECQARALLRDIFAMPGLDRLRAHYR